MLLKNLIIIIINIKIIFGTYLLRNVGTPASYNWDGAISGTTDSDIKSILQVLKTYSIPAATIAIQLNPSPTSISQSPPTTWRNPQYWWAYGYGINYQTVFRGASISKPVTAAIWKNNGILKNYINSTFYSLWEAFIGDLPIPKDYRVRQITIQHLLDHKAGFNNSVFGFDPAFNGKTIDSQLDDIISTYSLSFTPGTSFSYSNFGYMILARLAEGLTFTNYLSLIRYLFPSPSTVPVYIGDDEIAAPLETSIYYLQSPDGYFSVETMTGAGNVVTNAITWSWFATQYWIGSNNFGEKISVSPICSGCKAAWIFDGSMPGTNTVLVQFVNKYQQVSSICILMNTRDRSDTNLLADLNTAGLNLLKNKFDYA